MQTIIVGHTNLTDVYDNSHLAHTHIQDEACGNWDHLVHHHQYNGPKG